MWNEITDPITELTWPTRANGYPIIVKVAKECGTFSYRREISLSRKGNMKKKKYLNSLLIFFFYQIGRDNCFK